MLTLAIGASRGVADEELPPLEAPAAATSESSAPSVPEPASSPPAEGIGQALLPEAFLQITEEQRALTSVLWAPGARSVVLSKALQYLATYDKTVVEQQRRVKVLTAAGAEEDADFSFVIDPGEKLRSVAARTVLPDGTVVDATTDTIQRESEDGSLQVIHVLFPRVEPGAILDLRFSYEKDLRGVVPVWYVEEDLPVAVARLFTVQPGRLPVGINLPASGVSAEKYTAILRQVQRFTLDGLPSALVEPHAPPRGDRAVALLIPSVAAVVGDIPDAERSTRWVSIADDGRGSLHRWCQGKLGEASLLAKTLVPKGTDPVTAMQLVREAVQARVRVEGRSNFPRAERPLDVLEAGVGTTADVAGLCVAMLKQQGIDATLAMVRRRSAGHLPRRILAWSVFDDALVLLYKAGPAGEHVYASASTREPVGTIPAWAAGTQALPLVGKGDGLTLLPALTSAEHAQESRLELRLLPDGSARGTLRVHAHGRAAAHWRHVLEDLDKDARTALLRTALAEWSRDPELSRVAVARDAAPDGEDLVFRADVTLPEFGVVAGNRLVLAPFTWHRQGRADWSAEARVQDIDFERPVSHFDEVVVTLPAGVVTARLPEERDINAGAAGAYVTTCALDGGKLTATRRFRLDIERFAVAQYPELRRWHLAMAEADEQPVVLTFAE